MNDSRTTILKRDALGRIGYPRARREALLDEFERSGLKGAAFARTVGISYPTFANWIQKRRHARGDYGSPAPRRAAAGPGLRWLEAALPQAETAAPAPAPVLAESSAPLTVVLPCGTRLSIGDARQASLAAQFLQAFQAPLAPQTPAPCASC
jgi:hypothetical protein